MFIEDHPTGETDETRFALTKGILAGLLTYSPVGRTISMTKQGVLQAMAFVEPADGLRQSKLLRILRACASNID